MSDAFAQLGGATITACVLHVPAQGAWWADLDFESDPALEGAQVLTLGAVELHGTIDATASGTHGLLRRLRLLAGGGGWARPLAPKAYQNDAGVQAQNVAADAAREAGERLGAFSPELPRIGSYYVRQSGPAARVLEDVIGAVQWWVGFDGTTVVGERQASSPSEDAYEVLEYDGRSRLAVLAVDAVDSIGIGAQLTERLDEAQTVHNLEIHVTQEGIRVHAWCGGTARSEGRLVRLLRALARRATDGKIYGVHKYRVGELSVDRVKLQAVDRSAGLPDVMPVSMWPGLAGAHSSLALGAQVLVQFIGGNPTEPIVTHFAGKDGAGWIPTDTILSASSSLRLGSKDATDGVSLAPKVDPRVNLISAALDAFATAVPAAGDGGAAIHTAFTGAWGAPPHAAIASGSAKVLADE